MLAAITVAMPTCYAQVARSTKYSNSLIEVSGAQNPTYLALSEGREQLTYTVAVEYPADKIVAFVSGELQKKGWKPLREDFLNPGIPSFNVRGWASFDDAVQKPAARVYQWMTDWEDRTRDITVYDLEYRYPTSGAPNRSELHVLELYIPAPTVAKMKRDIALELQRRSHAAPLTK